MFSTSGMIESPASDASGNLADAEQTQKRSAHELPAQEREARAVARGIARLFARNNIWCLPEMPLRNGRRADLMGLDEKGRIVIVEIKVARADLLGDAKWPDYLDFCDRFFWGLPPHLDRSCLEQPEFLPERCGVIVADGYDAEILRPAPSLALAAARRKVEVERLARTALRRAVLSADPGLAALPQGN
ncbi:hypothetical protein NT2_04_02860 [Caenibius tardaugens NBRC 16725]|uniref:DNA repair protein MmcB-related protein n=1 Tax=Caenibius tardaugens NBRC 16725 TaxID=1219035 RepID=U3A2A7_9SPHN|nr:MmcB family DNA repair protein [Caenibius tardaugens]GAD48873.1 hypothetical protein NT2_04_02860 [Caenibius tardaugens NBRC 16725]